MHSSIADSALSGYGLTQESCDCGLFGRWATRVVYWRREHAEKRLRMLHRGTAVPVAYFARAVAAGHTVALGWCDTTKYRCPNRTRRSRYVRGSEPSKRRGRRLGRQPRCKLSNDDELEPKSLPLRVEAAAKARPAVKGRRAADSRIKRSVGSVRKIAGRKKGNAFAGHLIRRRCAPCREGV